MHNNNKSDQVNGCDINITYFITPVYFLLYIIEKSFTTISC